MSLLLGMRRPLGFSYWETRIPLTVGRVPFHVRYTTEFDETGRPLKAYGSATLVVDGESVLDADETTNGVDDRTEAAPSESSEN